MKISDNGGTIYVYDDNRLLDNPDGPTMVDYSDQNSPYYAKPIYFCKGLYLGMNLSNKEFKKLYSQKIKEEIFK